MLKKIWRNRLEFYPALSLFIWYTVGCALTSLGVQSRPGVGTLGWITLPSVIVFFIGVVRTYRELSSERREV